MPAEDRARPAGEPPSLAPCSACPAPPRRPAARRAAGSWLALASGLLALLLPKCPLCLAAYLSALGVTVGAASVALSVLRPLGLALALLAAAAILAHRLRTRRPAR
jgi:hypothetical protein